MTSSPASVHDGVVVIQPQQLEKLLQASSTQTHVIDRLVDEARDQVLRAAQRDGLTIAGEVGVRVLVEARATAYSRAPGDGLSDEEWSSLVAAHDGRRPLAYVKTQLAAGGEDA